MWDVCGPVYLSTYFVGCQKLVKFEESTRLTEVPVREAFVSCDDFTFDSVSYVVRVYW